MRLQRPIDPERDHLNGRVGAPLVLVEYGDFECPYCGRAFQELATVRQKLGRELTMVFRHFPLSRIHPHAVAAAEAAEAAGAQGRFWEMHDLLFQNQGELERADLVGYAHRLKLDVPRFEDALAQHAGIPHIEQDVSGGERSGVNGTPCFFINGHRHDDAWDADTLISALGQVLHIGAGIHAH